MHKMDLLIKDESGMYFTLKTDQWFSTFWCSQQTWAILSNGTPVFTQSHVLYKNIKLS